MEGKSKMYEGVRTWNPFVGCRFKCIYCRPSFQRLAKRRKKFCELCYRYEPHFHEERLWRIPSGKIIFACAFGDIAFAKEEEIIDILLAIEEQPWKTFYIQSKSGDIISLIRDNIGVPENVKLGITLETNLHEFNIPGSFKYYWEISQAPFPWRRAEQAGHVDYVTIEPILDFDDNFVDLIRDLEPEFVYIGYDNYNCVLPEPPLEKTLQLIDELKEFTEVRTKTIRKAWWER